MPRLCCRALMLNGSRRRAFSRSAKHVLILLFAALLSPLGFASDSPLAAFSERKWQMQDGLPEQVVQAFAQTADRYLWIGTTGGLLASASSSLTAITPLLFTRTMSSAF